MRIQRIKKSSEKEKTEIIDLSLLDKLIEKFNGKKGNLIPVLQEIQNFYGYLPKLALTNISEKLNIELNDIMGVATFYSQFRLKPVGKNIIKVCHGTACHVQNAKKITDCLKEELDVLDGETTEDGLFTLESVACLGCCSLAPVMMIGEDTFGKLTPEETIKIIKKYREVN